MRRDGAARPLGAVEVDCAEHLAAVGGFPTTSRVSAVASTATGDRNGERRAGVATEGNAGSGQGDYAFHPARSFSPKLGEFPRDRRRR